MSRYLRQLLSIALLVCITPSANGANLRKERKRQQRLERLANQKRNRCPASLPEDGSSCRRHPKLDACPYDFVQLPTAGVGGSCAEGSLICAPMVQCSCQGRTWACTDVPSAIDNICEAGDLPMGAYDDCSPDGTVTVDTPPEDNEPDSELESNEQQQEEQQEEEEDKDVFEQITNVDDTCPAAMPPSGSKCTRDPDLDDCPYDYTNLPVYEADGTCLGDVSCLPLGGCNCFNGVWECYTASVRRCRGDMPPRAFEGCAAP